MIDEIRPNPDQLLETFKRREKKKRGGRLYLFLGMAPGVGKTFAMILAAQEARKNGVDVVAGVIETHGRKETEALLAGLTFLPKMTLDYRGKPLTEMDLDGILARKPSLVLVDELAHTNVPGARHAKRWQDVYELLDAGIDVFSTLNVQHVESRKETVEQISGIRVQETVPDSVIDRAYQIRLIDLSPQDLIRRLKEGKVYLNEQAELAQENFFKEDRLTALREISLRLTAEKVDIDLQSYSSERSIEENWSVTERLLAMITPHASSETLIRATRKQAFNLEAPWIAVYIDTGHSLSQKQQTTLIKNLELARSLGAEVLTVIDTDHAQALIRLAVQKNVSTILLGRQSAKLKTGFWHRVSLLDKLLKSDFSIQVIQENPLSTADSALWWREFIHPEAGVASYLNASIFIISLTLINSLLFAWIGYRAVGFIFLLGTLVFSLSLSFGPIIFMAITTALIWGALFIPPAGELKLQAAEDFFMVTTYLVAAITMGTLARRSRRHQKILVRREARSRVLFEISQAIASSTGKDNVIQVVSQKIGEFLNARCDVILAKKESVLKSNGLQKLNLAKIDKELIVAQWVLDNEKLAGWSTDTLAGAEALYVPLIGSVEKIGVFAFKPEKNTRLLLEDQELLLSITKQLAISLERELLREKIGQLERLKDLDKMQRTLLNLMNEGVSNSASAIEQNVGTLESASIIAVDNTIEILDKMKLNVDNLLLLSRIAIGINPLQKSMISIKELFHDAKNALFRAAKNHIINCEIENDFSLTLDSELMRKALMNVLHNAVMVSPKGSTIEVRVIRSLKSAVIIVNDQGSPEDSPEKIFEKFSLSAYKDQRSIGFAVAKGIIKAHGGKISASNYENGGSVSITLPIKNHE